MLVVVNVLFWGQLFGKPDGNLRVYFLDVGQGDSTPIVTPNGRQVLIDRVPKLESATIALPPQYRGLNLVALTHLYVEHSRGRLKVSDRYRVRAALMGIQDSTATLYPQRQAAIDRNHASLVELSAGRVLDDRVVLETVHPSALPLNGSPSDPNNNALVFRLVYDEISFLLTADIEAETERQIHRNSPGLDVDILKASHHGSKTSTRSASLEADSPTVVVISAGADNRYGHPKAQVLTRLEQTVGAYRFYQAAQEGCIDLFTDGYSLWVESQK